MDSIRIEGMVFYGYHGVLAEETKLGQRFVVDVELFLDLRDAAATDDVAQTVNYGEVYDLTRRIVEGTPRQLIETVAGDICATLLDRFQRVQRIVVQLAKPSAPVPGTFQTVSARLDRSR